MSKIEVIRFPNRILRQKSKPIENIDDEILKIVESMAETMYAYRGIGLAAPQVGIMKNIIVLDIGQGMVSLMNPAIVAAEGSSLLQEGCLCLPEVFVDVDRKEKIFVKGVDNEGNPVSFDAEGMLARVLQHEIDHLNGVLIIDKLSKLKRDILVRKLKKQKIESEE
jgi:peptide deformylase